jgi:hypothetical protein
LTNFWLISSGFQTGFIRILEDSPPKSAKRIILQRFLLLIILGLCFGTLLDMEDQPTDRYYCWS